MMKKLYSILLIFNPSKSTCLLEIYVVVNYSRNPSFVSFTHESAKTEKYLDGYVTNGRRRQEVV